MLSSSDCESLAVAELLALEPDARERLLGLRLGYTEVPGSAELRDAIAAGYERVAPADVLALAAAEEGIFVAYHALLGAGEHAVIETPCYGSAIELARSTGAEVSEWRRRYEDGWAHDVRGARRPAAGRHALLTSTARTTRPARGWRRRSFARVLELAARALAGAVQRRGLQRSRARPGRRVCRRPPTPTSARSRWERCRRRTACRGCASAGSLRASRELLERVKEHEALHDDLLAARRANCWWRSRCATASG